MKKLFLILLISTAAFSFWSLLRNIYTADQFAEKAERYLSKLDTENAEKLIDKAIEKNKYEPNYYRLKAKILIIGAADKKEVLSNLQKSLSLNKDNLVTLRNCMPLYYFLATKNINVTSGVENIDENYIVTTREYFNFVKEKYSHDAGAVSLVAKYEKKLGLTDDYAKSVEIVRGLRPDLLEWHESFR